MIDFMVMEAVAVKIMREEAEAAKRQQRREWARDRSTLDNYR